MCPHRVQAILVLNSTERSEDRRDYAPFSSGGQAPDASLHPGGTWGVWQVAQGTARARLCGSMVKSGEKGQQG